MDDEFIGENVGTADTDTPKLNFWLRHCLDCSTGVASWMRSNRLQCNFTKKKKKKSSHRAAAAANYIISRDWLIDWLIDYDSVVTMSHAWDYLQCMLMYKLWCGHSSVVDTSQPIDPIPAACCRLGDFPAGLRQQRPIGLRIIRRLQSAINAVDRMVYNIRRNSDTFICFHWYQRIQFKTAAVLLVVLCRPFSDVVAEQSGRRSVRSCCISSHVVPAFHRPTRWPITSGCRPTDVDKIGRGTVCHTMDVTSAPSLHSSCSTTGWNLTFSPSSFPIWL